MHAFILSAATVALMTAGSAQSAPTLKFSGSLILASDGMSKGVSETDGNAQLAANVTASRGPFFAGFTLKNAKTAEGGDQQQQWFAGAKGKLGGFDVGARVLLKIADYVRPGTDRHYLEYQADASRTFGKTTLKAVYIYSPDSYGATREASWAEISLSQAVTPKLSLSAGLGRRESTPSKDYTAWNAGAAWTVAPGTTVDLRYYDTDRHGFGKKYGDSVVIALARKF